jgi:F0F1-type ATP synthase membrane subunit b/b'
MAFIQFLTKYWKQIIALVLLIWTIGAFVFFLLKTNYLKKKKVEAMLNESTIIIYNDEINRPPL